MLLIYLPKFSSRCNYVFDFIFKEELGIDYRTTSDAIEFQNYSAEKLNYSNSIFSNEWFIKAASLLFENEIKKQEIKIGNKNGTPVLFPNEDVLGFDIFAAVFYLVSRYEEYLPFVPDEYGRYRAANSFASQNDFLHLPVVNIWINLFKNILQGKFPSIKIKPHVFNAIVTYDIDVAYKYSGRNLGRTTGAIFKDILALNFKELNARIEVLLKRKNDPWDVYEDLEKIILENKLQSIFFFLLSDKSRHDRNLSYQNNAIKKLVNKIERFSEIGIHPSFYSTDQPEKIVIEKERLEKIVSKKIYKSRQHYLRFILPDTYNSLLAAGITEDYSMGFAGMPGFRAGTCKPFYFYDLKSEKRTPLKVFPVTFMEGTFIEKSILNPEESLEKMLSLLDEVKKVEGNFISIWHNHTISKTPEYTLWKNVHEKMIEKLCELLR